MTPRRRQRPAGERLDIGSPWGRPEAPGHRLASIKGVIDAARQPRGRPVIGSITNWARNVTYRAERLYRPESLDELRHLVAGQRRIRALGTGHTFNRLSDSDVLVSLDRLPSTVDIAGATAPVAAAGRHVQPAHRRDAAGYALAALASQPQLCVSGTMSTAPHRYGGLAT